MTVIEQQLLVTHSKSAVAKLMLDRYGISKLRVSILIQRVYERWKEEDALARPANRSSAIRRVERYIAQARGERRAQTPEERELGIVPPYVIKPDFQALFRFESLLADYQGTRAPVKVEVTNDVRVSVSLQAIIANMSPEEAARRIASARERRTLAEKQRLLMGPSVVQ